MRSSNINGEGTLITTLLHLLLLFGVPVATLAVQRRFSLPGWLNPVILCYAAGVLAGNAGLDLDRALMEGVVRVSVLIAIPLLLLPADLVAWLQRARTVALACALGCAAVCVATVATSLVFVPRVPAGWQIAGMLAGLFTGSAPNMVAVGTALGTPPETIVLVNTTDLVWGGLLCFVLLSPAVRVVGRFLGPYPQLEGDEADQVPEVSPASIAPSAWVASLCLGVALAGTGAAVALTVSPNERQLVGVLVATTLGIALSLNRRIRALPASAPLGELFVLAFCVGLGSLADVRALAEAGAAGWVLVWTGTCMAVTVGLHLLLCWIARIDRDTALITMTAGLYGPAFIPPVAANLGNRELVLSGVTAALAGLAVGNYVGVAMAWATRAALG